MVGLTIVEGFTDEWNAKLADWRDEWEEKDL